MGGASVLVMQNGNVMLQKGYGFADLKRKEPVDPESTIFRLASISKLFTWVSVMQLEERGKLDIDADVNEYLDFKIKPAFGKPITLRNLMTHTGGFEEETRTSSLPIQKKRSASATSWSRTNRQDSMPRGLSRPIQTTASGWPATSCSG